MKRLLFILVLSSLVFLCTACQRSEFSDSPFFGGCTIIYATDGEQAIGGNNEDGNNPLTRIWFLPGENGDYGRVYVGYQGLFQQGGMNDQGLFFDGAGVGDQVDVPQNGKEDVGLSLVDRIMRECATVDCVIDYFDTYHFLDIWSSQALFGDAYGNSVIIEPLHRIRMEGSYQVVTNFYQSGGDLRFADWRFRKATELLENATDLSVEYFRDVMDAVHVVDYYPTMYSTVYDLKGQDVYLYHFHDYQNVVVFDLSDELTQGAHAYDIASLFPENPEWEQWAKPFIDQYEFFIESNIDTGISQTIYDAYGGTYKMPEDMYFGAERMSVLADGVSLWLTFPTGIQLEFFPKSETSFFYVAPPGHGFLYEVTFDVGADGKATQLEFVDGETKYICEKQSDEIIHDLIPILQVENGMVKDENAAPNLIWIALIAGGVILVGGGGLAIFLRSRKK